uniref:CCHC-type domain-containing protein n=1 Tax=Podarcis muralis TaxID=64176 RepID=A0A670I1V5_PODMU
MASLVPLPPFAPASESWDSYLARFDCYLQANELTAVSKDRKRGLFLSLCGPEVFETARALVAPEAVQATPWDTIQEKLRNHYAPKPSKIAARHAFYHRNQAEGESINNYTTALRQAAMHCEFRDLDDALMDRIVCGVRDIHLQRRLLAKPDLTLQKAIEEAVASEAAERSAQEIRKSSSPRLAREPVPVHHEEASSEEASSSEDDDVHQTKRERRKFQQKSKGQPECAGCGGNHSRAKCRFRDAICRKCSRRGHIAKVCRSAPSDTPPSSTRKSKSSLQSAKESCFALTNCRCPSGTTIGQTDSPTRRKLNVTVLIEGAPCDMEIDTGSALSIVSWSTIKRLVPRVSKRQLDSHRVHLRDYQGNDIPVVGVGRFRIAFKDFSGLLRLVVVEGQRPSLLGLDWFDALGLEVTGINCISNAETEGLVKDFAVAEPPGCANAPRSFVPGNQVFARNYVGDIPWVPATVVGVTGPRSYQVALEDGRLWRRHIDQLRRRVGDLDTTEVPPTALAAPEETRTDGEAPPTPPSQTASVEPNQAVSEQTQTTPLVEAPLTAADPGELVPTPPRVAPQPQRELCGPPDLATSPRRSGRVSKRPTHLKDYVVGQVSLLV